MLPGTNERLLPLTGGQPSAGQIRSRRICHSLAAFKQLELFRVYCYIPYRLFPFGVNNNSFVSCYQSPVINSCELSVTLINSS
ncbi:hypothetical protein CDA56_24560 [Klebsiella michiganensis]|nr:hypothetical protein F7Q97_01820 [Klebsiella michiganensis]MBX4659788.1 hypothetical protein [Klebsiella michiganensis]MBX4799527.1 hypothetical protein [Klebsiella michiganensis]MBX8657380.1 hypothetical protein [Klebsiella michiganensis]MBZ7462519.1 hypothetical protein [Klebsiella michiganensis]